MQQLNAQLTRVAKAIHNGRHFCKADEATAKVITEGGEGLFTFAYLETANLVKFDLLGVEEATAANIRPDTITIDLRTVGKKPAPAAKATNVPDANATRAKKAAQKASAQLKESKAKADKKP
jgi:hypothetical protein